MRPEDINLNNDADEFMQMMKLNQKLEETVELQDKAIFKMQKIIDDLKELAKIKEFALFLYINALEDELDIPEDKRMSKRPKDN